MPALRVPVWNGHGDAVNLRRLNADGTLTLANSDTYDTWGKPTTATHNGAGDLGFRFTYVGEFDVGWDDQLGLDLAYMHARHYSPALGRFVQPDPDRSEANLYAYAANN
jgi:RHS repeat-associated protein